MPKRNVLTVRLSVDKDGRFKSFWAMSKTDPGVVTMAALAALCDGAALLMADIARRTGHTADDIQKLLEAMRMESAADGKPAAAAGMAGMRISLN